VSTMSSAPRTGPVGVGIIGAGVISETYLENLTTFPDIIVHAIGDLDPEAAAQRASEFDIETRGGVDVVLTHPDIEIVINLTVPLAHAEVALATIAAGKHPYSDKPLSLDLHTGRQILEAAAALLLNFEEEIVAAFGDKYSLAYILRFPEFIGTFTDGGEKTLRRLRDKLPADLKRFTAEFHSGLPDGTGSDPRFELRLRVVLERVVRDPEALSMQFTRWDDMTDDEKELVEKMGKRGQTVIREQKRAVVGHGLLGAGEAERRVAAAIPYRFNSRHFLDAG
jgi:hypothetical protein